MKKTSVLLIALFCLGLGTGIGVLIASPRHASEAPKDLPSSTEADVDSPDSMGAELPASSVAWATTSHSFGEIPQNQPVKFKYEFTNTGKEDLKVLNVKASCGCTTPKWTTEPVKPGEKGFIEAEFDAKSEGIFKKSVTITMNTEPSITVLNFDGSVVKP